MRRRALAASAILLLVGGAFAWAHTSGFTRFYGGGPVRTDCMIVADVAGAFGSRAVARCTDGDPACDADARPDGSCLFRIRLCLVGIDLASARCHTDVVTAAEAIDPDLQTALQALSFPVATVDTCTPEVRIALPRPRRRARMVLRTKASMASGHADRDRIALVCRKPGAGTATFATLESRVFAPSCAQLSCHGAAGAGGLVLTRGAAYGNLVNVLPTNTVARDAGLVRVSPGELGRSFLLKKLEGDLAPGEGEPMPRVGVRLDAASIDLVRRWIAAGAPAEAVF